MLKRLFIIHGWNGYPEEGWFPWLKRTMTTAGAEVHVPTMPEAANPKIDVWVPFLSHAVGQPNEQTFFVGHSIGGQAILRYLQNLPEGVRVGGVVLVAPWMTLSQAAVESESDSLIADPWMHRPIDWIKVRHRTDKFTAIFSADDPWVPLENKDIFRKGLNAQIVIEHGKKHFSGADGVNALASAKVAIQGMMGPA